MQATPLTTRTFKYLVSYNAKLQQFAVGYCPDWKYHLDIQATFPEGFRPRSGGLVTVDFIGVGNIQSVALSGHSEGFDVYPRVDRDLPKIIACIENGEWLFAKDGTAIE